MKKNCEITSSKYIEMRPCSAIAIGLLAALCVAQAQLTHIGYDEVPSTYDGFEFSISGDGKKGEPGLQTAPSRKRAATLASMGDKACSKNMRDKTEYRNGFGAFARAKSHACMASHACTEGCCIQAATSLGRHVRTAGSPYGHWLHAQTHMHWSPDALTPPLQWVFGTMPAGPLRCSLGAA